MVKGSQQRKRKYRRKADSLRPRNSRQTSRVSKRTVSKSQNLTQKKSSPTPKRTRSAVLTPETRRKPQTRTEARKKHQSQTKTEDKVSTVQPYKTKPCTVSISPISLTAESQTICHKGITFELKKVAGKEDCFRVNDISSEGVSEMSTKSVGIINNRHRKNVARKSTTKPPGFEAKLAQQQQKRPAPSSSSTSWSSRSSKRANTKDVSRKDQLPDQTDSDGPLSSPVKSKVVNGVVAPKPDQSEVTTTNGKANGKGKPKEDKTQSGTSGADGGDSKSLHPTIQKLRSSRSRSPSPSTANSVNSRNSPSRNSGSSDNDSDGAPRRDVAESSVRKSSRLSFSTYRRSRTQDGVQEPTKPQENGELGENSPGTSQEKPEAEDSDVVMLDDIKVENSSMREEAAHKDDQSNLGGIAPEQAKPKRNLIICQEKLKSVVSKAQLHLSAAKAKRNEDSIKRDKLNETQGSPEISNKPLNLVAKKTTDTVSVSVEKAGGTVETNDAPVSPVVNDEREVSVSQGQGDETREIENVNVDNQKGERDSEEGRVTCQESSLETTGTVENEIQNGSTSDQEGPDKADQDGGKLRGDTLPAEADDVSHEQSEAMEADDLEDGGKENVEAEEEMETEESQKDNVVQIEDLHRLNCDEKKDVEREAEDMETCPSMETSEVSVDKADAGEPDEEGEKHGNSQETQDTLKSESEISNFVDLTVVSVADQGTEEQAGQESGKEESVEGNDRKEEEVKSQDASEVGSADVMEIEAAKEGSQLAAVSVVEDEIAGGETTDTAESETADAPETPDKTDAVVVTEATSEKTDAGIIFESGDAAVAAGKNEAEKGEGTAKRGETDSQVKDEASDAVKGDAAAQPKSEHKEEVDTNGQRQCKRSASPTPGDETRHKRAKVETNAEEQPENKQDIKKDIVPDLSKINLELFKKELTELVAKAYEERRREDRATIAVLKQKVATLQEQNRLWEQKIKQLRQSTTGMMKEQERAYIKAMMSKKPTPKEVTSIGIQVEKDTQDRETNTATPPPLSAARAENVSAQSLAIGATTPKAAAPFQPSPAVPSGSPAVAEITPSLSSVTQPGGGNQVLPGDSANQSSSLKTMLGAPPSIQPSQTSRTPPAAASIPVSVTPAIQQSKPTTPTTTTTTTPDVLTITSTGPTTQSAPSRSKVPPKRTASPTAATGKKTAVIIDLTEDEESGSPPKSSASSASPLTRNEPTTLPQKQKPQQPGLQQSTVTPQQGLQQSNLPQQQQRQQPVPQQQKLPQQGQSNLPQQQPQQQRQQPVPQQQKLPQQGQSNLPQQQQQQQRQQPVPQQQKPPQQGLQQSSLPQQQRQQPVPQQQQKQQSAPQQQLRQPAQQVLQQHQQRPQLQQQPLPVQQPQQHQHQQQQQQALQQRRLQQQRQQHVARTLPKDVNVMQFSSPQTAVSLPGSPPALITAASMNPPSYQSAVLGSATNVTVMNQVQPNLANRTVSTVSGTVRPGDNVLFTPTSSLGPATIVPINPSTVMTTTVAHTLPPAASQGPQSVLMTTIPRTGAPTSVPSTITLQQLAAISKSNPTSVVQVFPAHQALMSSALPRSGTVAHQLQQQQRQTVPPGMQVTGMPPIQTALQTASLPSPQTQQLPQQRGIVPPPRLQAPQIVSQLQIQGATGVAQGMRQSIPAPSLQQQRPPAVPPAMQAAPLMQTLASLQQQPATQPQPQAQTQTSANTLDKIHTLKDHQRRLLDHKAELLSKLKHNPGIREIQEQIQSLIGQEQRIQGEISSAERAHVHRVAQERLQHMQQFQQQQQQQQQQNQLAVQHPAPLPQLPGPQRALLPHQLRQMLPGKPSLKISKVNNGIVLSWTMAIDPQWAQIETYLLYAYQESEGPPSTLLWKKIGDVRALPLPMACTLTQFQPGSVYHFAVCAVDIYQRSGAFSDPAHIDLASTR